MQFTTFFVALMAATTTLAAPIGELHTLEARQNIGSIASKTASTFNAIRNSSNGLINQANGLSAWQGSAHDQARNALERFRSSIINAEEALNTLGDVLRRAGANYQAQDTNIQGIFR